LLDLAQRMLGTILVICRTSKARAIERTALRVAPDYADAMFNLALLLQRTNQYVEADYWRRYLASDCQSDWAARARLLKNEEPPAGVRSCRTLTAP
jgi:hypothetical protein